MNNLILLCTVETPKTLQMMNPAKEVHMKKMSDHESNQYDFILFMIIHNVDLSYTCIQKVTEQKEIITKTIIQFTEHEERIKQNDCLL